MEGCNDLLLQECLLASGGGGGDDGGGGGGDDQAEWGPCSGDRVAWEMLVALAGCIGAAALADLRAAAAAGSFEEVALVLDAIEAVKADEQQQEAPGRAAAPISAGAAVGAVVGDPGTARACAACGAAGAPLMCSGCLAASYCGAECQRRDWRAHKAACKQRQQEMAAAAAAAGSSEQQQ